MTITVVTKTTAMITDVAGSRRFSPIRLTTDNGGDTIEIQQGDQIIALTKDKIDEFTTALNKVRSSPPTETLETPEAQGAA